MTIKVGVLRGGPSEEHEVSLKTGEAVLGNLPFGYEGRDIVLSKNGDWIFERRISHPEKVFRSVDVIFNAFHGYFGEDGKVQQVFEQFNMPYTGSGVLASAIGMNKILARDMFVKAGLNMPRAVVVEENDNLAETANKIFNSIGSSIVVKPACSGSSMGVSIVNGLHSFIPALEIAFKFGPKIIAEEYIGGKEASCGVVDNFRGQRYYSLPAIEIVPPAEHKFFNYDAKYSGATREICPGNFSAETKKKIEEMARTAHEIINCYHYSRSDFRVAPNGKVYILEINTLPGLTTESLLPKSIEAVGSSYSEFLEHVLGLALAKK